MASISILEFILDIWVVNCILLYFKPPASILIPRTRRRLPIIDPVSEALTTSK
jgi:hypothetical protein